MVPHWQVLTLPQLSLAFISRKLPEHPQAELYYRFDRCSATPDYVWEKLKTLDFRMFLGKPKTITKPAVGYLGRTLISFKSKDLARSLLAEGCIRLRI